MKQKVIKRVPRSNKKKPSIEDEYEMLRRLRAYADRYRKPNGNKLSNRERQYLLTTGELPGHLLR